MTTSLDRPVRNSKRKSPRKEWWFSCRLCTVLVVVDTHQRVTHTAPITSKFIGQHMLNLSAWMMKHGDFRSELLANY